jgi:hypothetical protein
VSGPLVAEFRDPGALRAGLREVQASGNRALDAFTPFPVEGVADSLGETGPSRMRPAMLVSGVVFAAAMYALQWWSAVYDYPINVGGRPLHSWPVFLLVPFEVGVLAASLAGVIALFRGCGLPRLHDPLFAVPGFERASQDRFFLLAEDGEGQSAVDLRHVLERAGALAVTEVRR